MESIRAWFERHLADPQVMGLAVVLLAGFFIIFLTGEMLAPNALPRLVAVLVVFVGFIAFMAFVTFALLPLLSRQATQLFQLLPEMLTSGQDALMRLPQRYPELFSEAQIRDLIDSIRIEALSYGQHVVSLSVSSVVSVITVAVYLVLMPLLVFFFLKDKGRIVNWFVRFLPTDRGLLTQVWGEVDGQIGNYVRGKFIEIVIVWIVTYLTFAIMGMQFATLLSVLIGLSVLIPYIGAAAVTLPVAILAYFQWGVSPEFWWLMLAYGIIQALDGNVLVPLLFSEVVNLHPVAIIVAILVFGGLWGFWGVFFAIPLATLVQAVLKAWPTLVEN
jgi:putative permease